MFYIKYKYKLHQEQFYLVTLTEINREAKL